MKSEKRIPFFLAWKHIVRSNKWTLGLIVFFMSIAFINMIFISSLFNGIIDGFNKQIINMSTGHILIMPHDGNEIIDNVDNLMNILNETEGVVGASPQIAVPGTLQYKGTKGTWRVTAIDPDLEKKVTLVSEKMMAGEYLAEDDKNGIIIGKDIAGLTADKKQSESPFTLQGVSVGDEVILNTVYGQTNLTVRGIFYSKFLDTDNRAYISLATYEQIQPLKKPAVNSFIVRINKTGQEQMIINKLQDKGVDQKLYSWEAASDLMDSIGDSFLSINIILSIVGILIAAITVFIVIYIDIINKRKQIGILRAIGIKPYLIHITYILQTVVYSVSGILLGSAIFFFGIIPYFKAHPFELPIADAVLTINYLEFIGRLETLIVVAILAGMIPAIHITRIKILDAIWGR